MSFVTENSRLSGYKTCIEALKHPMYTWLRSHTWLEHCSMLDLCGHCPLNLTAPSSWDQKKTGLLRLILCPQCFQGVMSELCGPFPPPQACGLKRFRELRNGSVLWFGFLFVILPLPWPPGSLVSVEYGSDSGWLQTSPYGKAQWGCFSLCVLCKEESQYLWAFRDSVLLLCLSNGCSHFY